MVTNSYEKKLKIKMRFEGSIRSSIRATESIIFSLQRQKLPYMEAYICGSCERIATVECNLRLDSMR